MDRPENTVAAIERAIEAGATAVEVDVRTTRDGQLVIMHDATVDRTTDGAGKVSDLTAAEISKLDAGIWFPRPRAGHFRGQRVLSLREVLERCGDRVDVVLDLKETDEVYAERVAAAVKQHGRPERTILGLRSAKQAKAFRRLLPGARQLAFIPKATDVEAFLAAEVDAIRLWPEWINAQPELADVIRGGGALLHINAATGTMQEIVPLLAYRPDSLLCDDPGQLVATLDELKRGAERVD